MNVKMTLSYKGTDYLGFQKTKAGKTIQQELEKALFQILQRPVFLQVASRTDAGVHAKFQVVSFFIDSTPDLKKLKQSLNALLPSAISILSLENAPAFFHASLDAREKTYQYFICTERFHPPFTKDTSWHYCYKKINVELLQSASKFFIGKKNFAFLTSSDYEDPYCTISNISIFEKKGELIIEVTGNRFLHKMVRVLVGTLVNLSTGKIPLSEIENFLTRENTGVTAPAKGLFLTNIDFALKTTHRLNS